MASNIRYGDRSDNVTCPDLIGNERSGKVRTLTRRHANAGCPCGSLIAGNDKKWGCNDGRRDRQGLNDASCSVNVEHGSVIHPRGMIGSPRFKHSGRWLIWELTYFTHLSNSHTLTAARITVAAAAPPTNVHNGPRSLSSPRIRPENTGMNS